MPVMRGGRDDPIQRLILQELAKIRVQLWRCALPILDHLCGTLQVRVIDIADRRDLCRPILVHRIQV